MAGAGYPQLAGQWADYVQTKLKDFKAGTAWGDDNNAKVMPEVAKHLGDSDIAALASYVEGLHSAAADAKATAAR
jgi:cytochrome c553